MKNGPADLRNFLKTNIQKSSLKYFGIKDVVWHDKVTNNWFDDSNNYDGRWQIIRDRVPYVGRVLDVSAGCGTFILYGLQNGCDVWGIEPEEWKREYFRRKILESAYPIEFLPRIVKGMGEALPFDNENFDIVTTYQTLEHVNDVEKCINEMLRVLKPGGILYVRAPDYNSFYEPHYRLPFLPKMNKKLASTYLKLLKRPTEGLDTLNWITEKEIIQCILRSEYKVNIEQMKQYYSYVREKKIKKILPEFLKKKIIIRFLNRGYELKTNIISMAKVGRQENTINIWVTKSV